MSTLFEQIEREDIANRLELDKRQQIYLPLIGAFSQANDPYEMRSQLIGANGVASLGLENSQASELPEPFIRWRTGFICLLYTSPSPRDGLLSRMPSSA